MGQKKLIRFEEIKSFGNVMQYPEGMAGKWVGYFKNDHPVTLELACGKGEYAVGLGERYPDQNFIGLDLKGNRLWVGAKKASALGLNNVAFIRTQIDQLASYFAKNEIASIWITFPDPQLRMSKAKKRLTHPRFLRLYQQVLLPGGRIRLKTDSPDLFEFTREVIRLYGCTIHQEIGNVHAMTEIPQELQIKTHYEALDIAGSKRIHFIEFSLPAEIPGESTDALLKEWVFRQGGVEQDAPENDEE